MIFVVYFLPKQIYRAWLFDSSCAIRIGIPGPEFSIHQTNNRTLTVIEGSSKSKFSISRSLRSKGIHTIIREGKATMSFILMELTWEKRKKHKGRSF